MTSNSWFIVTPAVTVVRLQMPLGFFLCSQIENYYLNTAKLDSAIWNALRFKTTFTASLCITSFNKEKLTQTLLKF